MSWTNSESGKYWNFVKTSSILKIQKLSSPHTQGLTWARSAAWAEGPSEVPIRMVTLTERTPCVDEPVQDQTRPYYISEWSNLLYLELLRVQDISHWGTRRFREVTNEGSRFLCKCGWIFTDSAMIVKMVIPEEKKQNVRYHGWIRWCWNDAFGGLCLPSCRPVPKLTCKFAYQPALSSDCPFTEPRKP